MMRRLACATLCAIALIIVTGRPDAEVTLRAVGWAPATAFDQGQGAAQIPIGRRGGPAGSRGPRAKGSERHFLYVAAPGIRNYLEFGGAGILVFDIDNGHTLRQAHRRRRRAGRAAAGEHQGRLRQRARPDGSTSPRRSGICLDLVPRRLLWEKALPGGCDRMAITPDGKVTLRAVVREGHWNVVDAATGDVHREDRAQERRAQHGVRPRRRRGSTWPG